MGLWEKKFFDQEVSFFVLKNEQNSNLILVEDRIKHNNNPFNTQKEVTFSFSFPIASPIPALYLLAI
jgi:hypothetical protein